MWRSWVVVSSSVIIVVEIEKISGNLKFDKPIVRIASPELEQKFHPKFRFKEFCILRERNQGTGIWTELHFYYHTRVTHYPLDSG